MESDMNSILFTLPPEVRTLIYKFAFTQSEPLQLRCPTKRRLRPSRPAKSDSRGLLDTCSLIRSEAITSYYSVNPLVFRSADQVLTFISDQTIHPHIKSSVTHIAVDFGDTTDADSILKDHIQLVDRCISDLPRLKVLETRFYARTLDSYSSSHFQTLALAFDGLDADMNAPPSPRSGRSSPRDSISSLSDCSMDADPDMSIIQAEVLEQYCFTPSAAVAFANSKLKFSVCASSAHYPGVKHDKLICYNLKIGMDGIPNALGGAKDAVAQRVSRIGMLPRRLSEMYDTAADSGFHQRVRATLGNTSCARIDVGVS